MKVRQKVFFRMLVILPAELVNSANSFIKDKSKYMEEVILQFSSIRSFQKLISISTPNPPYY
jgi:hypothetical protein